MRDYTKKDDMAFARGVRNALLLSVPLWGLIGAAVFSCSASAQVTATSGAQAGAGATSGADASSGSTANITQNYYSGGTTRIENAGRVGQDITYGGGTNNVQRQIIEGGTSDRYRATIRNTPDAYAPNVSGGTNSCLVGMSGAGSVAGFGFGLGGNWSDPDCERRQLAALAHNTGNHALAQEVMCGAQVVRDARIRMNQPCLVDIQIAQERARQQQAQAQQRPAVVPVGAGAPAPAAVITPAAVPAAPVGRNDWCSGVGLADSVATRRSCGWTGPAANVRPR